MKQQSPRKQAPAKKKGEQAPARPVKSFRLRGVSASVFENHTTIDGRDVTFFKVSLQRTYKEGDEFKHTTSLGRDDLPVARLLLGRAWEWILEAEARNRREEDEGGSEEF